MKTIRNEFLLFALLACGSASATPPPPPYVPDLPCLFCTGGLSGYNFGTTLPDSVDVAGYSSAGDGGAATFYRMGTTCSTNDITIVKDGSPSPHNCYYRVDGADVPLSAYGVTPTAGDALTALNHAIDDINGNIIHSVLVPSGTWTFVGNPKEITGTGWDIHGAGPGATHIIFTSAEFGTLLTAGTSGVSADTTNRFSFGNLTIDEQPTNPTSWDLPAINIVNAADGFIHDIDFLNAATFITIGTSTTSGQRIYAENWTGDFNNGITSACNIGVVNATNVQFVNGGLNPNGTADSPAGAFICLRPAPPTTGSDPALVDTVTIGNWRMQSPNGATGKPYGLVIDTSNGNVNNVWQAAGDLLDWTSTAGIDMKCSTGGSPGYLHGFRSDQVRVTPGTGPAFLAEWNCPSTSAGLSADNINIVAPKFVSRSDCSVPVQLLNPTVTGGSPGQAYNNDRMSEVDIQDVGCTGTISAAIQADADGWTLSGGSISRLGNPGSATKFARVFNLTNPNITNLSIAGPWQFPSGVDWMQEPSYTNPTSVGLQIWRPKQTVQFTSGDSHTTLQSGGFGQVIEWNVNDSNAKTLNISKCDSSLSGVKIGVVDLIGNAGTGMTPPNITIAPATGSTILKQASTKIKTNSGRYNLACDGPNNNWYAISDFTATP